MLSGRWKGLTFRSWNCAKACAIPSGMFSHSSLSPWQRESMSLGLKLLISVNEFRVDFDRQNASGYLGEHIPILSLLQDANFQLQESSVYLIMIRSRPLACDFLCDQESTNRIAVFT